MAGDCRELVEGDDTFGILRNTLTLSYRQATEGEKQPAFSGNTARLSPRGNYDSQSRQLILATGVVILQFPTLSKRQYFDNITTHGANNHHIFAPRLLHVIFELVHIITSHHPSTASVHYFVLIYPL